MTEKQHEIARLRARIDMLEYDVSRLQTAAWIFFSLWAVTQAVIVTLVVKF